MIAIGIGCRRGASAGEIREALDAVLSSYQIPVAHIGALATERTKADEIGIVSLAQRLGLQLLLFEASALAAASDRVITRSDLVLETKGTPSIAEAAALLAAGRDAVLLGPRIARHGATAAIAVGDGT